MKKILLLFIIITLGIAGILVQQNSEYVGAPNTTTEPATMLLFGAGLIGLAGIRFKGKK